MALMQRRNQPAYMPVVDVRAAQRWQRKGAVTRGLTYVLAQERARHERDSWRLYRAYGMDQSPTAAGFNPMRASHWLGRR